MRVVPGDPANLKMTSPEDLAAAERRLAASPRHADHARRAGGRRAPFAEDPHRTLVLGGVRLEGARGLGGHSDADAVSHAVADAVAGAAGLGDLGQHFPDRT